MVFSVKCSCRDQLFNGNLQILAFLLTLSSAPIKINQTPKDQFSQIFKDTFFYRKNHTQEHCFDYFRCFGPGILWNLSSKDPLKKEIAKETIPGLTDKILKPLAMSMMEEAAITDKPERQISCDDSDDSGEVYISPPDEEIFCNTTGCFRYPSTDL